MSDASDGEDIESIRERKKEELQEPTTPVEPVHVDGEDHLNDLVGDHDVVLVDFYADWCGPCQMLEPVVESIASDTAAVVAKVDVDEHEALAGEYGVRGVPTLFLFAGGEAVEQLVGMQDESTLLELVEQHS
ncbi:thioredoxin [Halobacteriales archaeon QH_10_67_22]|nr:MAG: thioredoxin [Halobacteriales archaeon QH_10_67_22]